MRGNVVLVLGLLVAGVPAASAADCKGEVLAAFEKQYKAPAYRVQMAQPSAEGDVNITVDYVPPSKMLQTVTGGNMPGEQQTMLVGDHAYSGSNGVWEELLPQFTQSIVAEFAAATGKAAQNPGDFDCLGTAAFEGKDYKAYRTKVTDEQIKAAGAAGAVARTLYVDLTTGLPAFNVVAPLKAGAPPVMKAVYSYPAEVEIEAPVNAPVQKAK